MNAFASPSLMEELAGRMAAQEEQAFVEFAEFFGPRFRALFQKRGLAAWEADDLAISCITDIALKVDKYSPRPESGFAAWVFTLARRRLVDWWREQKPALRYEEDLLPDNSTHLDSEPDMEVVQAVREAIIRFPETEQAIIRLRDMGPPLSYVEIGNRLGMRPGTARVRHYRAIKRLESVLQGDPRIRRLLDRLVAPTTGVNI